MHQENICTINAGPPGLSLCYVPALVVRTSPHSPFASSPNCGLRKSLGGRWDGNEAKRKLEKEARRTQITVDGRAVGAQRFRDADLLLSDGATCSCCYALLSRRAAPRCRWWLLRCCAPRPRGKELANSLLVALQLVVGVKGGLPRVLFGKGKSCMLWTGKVARVSLCVLVRFSPCRGLVRCEARSFFLSEGLTDIRMWYSGLAGRACSLLATTRGDPESWTIKPDLTP